MNENLNLVEILKDCPKRTKLYSTVYGEVEYDGIRNGSEYPVKYVKSNDSSGSVTAQGLVLACYDGECTLFPSKEQRDWSKFKQLVKPKFKVGDKIVYSLGKRMGAPGSYGIISEITNDKYIFTDTSYAFIRNQDGWELASDKKPKFDPKTLRAFDKVLVRLSNESYNIWYADFVSQPALHENEAPMTISSNDTDMVIPYNDDTKHLVGTTQEAPEYYRYWED